MMLLAIAHLARVDLTLGRAVSVRSAFDELGELMSGHVGLRIGDKNCEGDGT